MAKNNNIWIWVVGIVAVLFLTGVVSMDSLFGDKDTDTEIAGGATDCNIAPSLSFAVNDALQKGTSVATIEGIRLNGVLLGGVPSSFKYGDEVEILYNASNYISVVGPKHKMVCGVNTLAQEIYATDDPTIRLFNTDGNRIADNVLDTCVTNDGINQSSSSASISMKLEVQSAPLQSSGDLALVVEVDNSTEVGYDGISISGSGVSDGAVLSTYTQNSTTSTVKAFNLPASVNGALNTYYVNLKPKSGQSIGPAGSAGTEVYLTLYSKQAFVDTDGTFKVGIEDANGNTKYEDTQRFGFCVVGS
jgi:hypothetical protein